MPLNVVNFVQNGHLIHQDLQQFVDLLTGVMIDQPVHVVNTVTANTFLGNGAVPPGGATSQVLSKTAAADYAVAWATPSAGNVGTLTYEVQAVTGSTITLPNLPTTNGTLAVFINGQALIQTRDWTIAGQVITFTTPLTADDVKVIFTILTATGSDAATVNGIAAYPASNPQPNNLVATGADGKLPASVVPAIANLLTNGGFEIWQRGNGPFTANAAYTADRWQIGLAGTDTLSVSSTGTTIDVGNGGSLAAACTFVKGTGTNTSLNATLSRSADNNSLRGRTLSASIRVNTATPSAVSIAIGSDGTGGTLSPGTVHTGGSTWQTLTKTYTPPTDATYVLVLVLFNASCTAYLDNAMLVVGAQAADYVPLHPADDLARCLRYYESFSQGGTWFMVGMNFGTAATQGPFRYRVFKPVVPTITVVNPTQFSVMNAAGGLVPATAASSSTVSLSECLVIFNVASGSLVAANAALVSAGQGASTWGNFFAEANP